VCDPLHDTSRYDAAEKVLSFLLACTMCGIETVEYEPRPGLDDSGRGANSRMDSVMPGPLDESVRER